MQLRLLAMCSIEPLADEIRPHLLLVARTWQFPLQYNACMVVYDAYGLGQIAPLLKADKQPAEYTLGSASGARGGLKRS